MYNKALIMKFNYAFTVLNWNGEEDTKKCLKSLDAVEYDSYEVILVDNGSEAESVKSHRGRGCLFAE